jgi:hypothetical protein
MAHVLQIEYLSTSIAAKCECGLEFIPYREYEGYILEQWYENVIDMHRKHVRSVHGLNTILHDNDRFISNPCKENEN